MLNPNLGVSTGKQPHSNLPQDGAIVLPASQRGALFRLSVSAGGLREGLASSAPRKTRRPQFGVSEEQNLTTKLLFKEEELCFRMNIKPSYGKHKSFLSRMEVKTPF